MCIMCNKCVICVNMSRQNYLQSVSVSILKVQYFWGSAAFLLETQYDSESVYNYLSSGTC